LHAFYKRDEQLNAASWRSSNKSHETTSNLDYIGQDTSFDELSKHQTFQ